MAKKEQARRTSARRELESEMENIQRHLDLLDQRLDNIDSMVTAVAERVTKQPIIVNVTCSHCGQSMEIALMGLVKPKP